jgi:preprotein translocase subunit SecE
MNRQRRIKQLLAALALVLAVTFVIGVGIALANGLLQPQVACWLCGE